MKKKKQPQIAELPDDYRDDLLGKNSNRQSTAESESASPQRKRLEDLGDSL